VCKLLVEISVENSECFRAFDKRC